MMKSFKLCADRIFGISAVVIGTLCVYECFRLYPIANSRFSGDHVIPGIAGAVLIILGVIVTLRPGARRFTVQFPDKATSKSMIGSLIVLIVYVILINVLGFLLSTALCGIFLFRLFGGYSWLKCVAAALLTAVLLNLVFISAFGMAFPRGIWG